MKFLMQILETEEDFAHRRRQGAEAEAYWTAWAAYMAVVAEKRVEGYALAGDGEATTIRVRDGERQIQDGPYAESRESLGGYMIFEVDSLEEAMELAAACPAASSGAVEVRRVSCLIVLLNISEYPCGCL